MKASTQRRLKLAAAHVFLIGFIAIILFPFLMIIAISFRKGNFALGALIPTGDNFSLEHWKYVLGIPYEETGADGATRTVKATTPVLVWFWNSLKVSCSASAMIIFLSGTCAYAFARMQFYARETLLKSLLILQVFPMVLALVALYALLQLIGEFLPIFGLNTHPGLILTYLGGVAVYIWMIKGYFDTIPVSIEESAKIDGATHFQAFVRILLPMSLPIFAVVFILSFISHISEYPVASVVLQTEGQWTLAVGAQSFLYEQNYLWGKFAATAVLSGLPITLMFLICQKFLISGLTSGGVKE
ncbi:maltose ABC transporter permease MalG [Geminisphaera colitermitum]|uniref:maltose ABC transporter permease MalG n=1 Tax=Geminisphaera colitermitum TaxID=1148786 RepID=UPI0005BB13CB|nr:maltose ABC transporter permease MalG [Geminisphaera colitermitum]